MAAMTAPIRLSGRVEHVYYSSPRFCASRLRTHESVISFVGPVMVRPHEPVILHGRWQTHKRYGRQLAVERLEYDMALDADGLANYLANHPDVKGIGPVKARKIADQFGADFARVLQEDPEAIAKVAHIPLTAVHALQAEWERTETTNTALVWLAGFGLTHHQVTTLVERLGNSVIALLQSDPYLISREVPGFGFRRVDQIARKLNTAKDHPSRLRAGIIHCVEGSIEDGHCWVEYQDLIDQANLLLVMDCLDSRDRIEQALETLIDDGTLSCSSMAGRILIANPKLAGMEADLEQLFTQTRQQNAHFSAITGLERMVSRSAPTLNAQQRQAVLYALKHPLSLTCGGAGSGKTFTIAVIANLYEEQGLSVMLAAPTGKAAKRLEQMTGREAKTIHRLLGYDGRNFARTANSPLEADVIILDEVSMTDLPLAWHFFQAIDLERTAVVLVGDHNQLPPVGPGNLLRDLVTTRMLPTTVLDEIVRQAGPLKENSIAILAGEVRPSAPKQADGRRPWYLLEQFSQAEDIERFLLDLFENVLSERLNFDLIEDVQVLTPTRKGPLGVEELNIKLQRLLQQKLWGVTVDPPRTGHRPKLLLHDKVMQTRNNYSLDVMNGAVGTVVGVTSKYLQIRFDEQVVEIEKNSAAMKDLSLAYAMTFHKGQGSEFPCAIVLIHKAHDFMHHRNLFYTGVTRAQKSAIIIGDRRGIRTCARKCHLEQRRTFLSLLEPRRTE